MPNLSHDMAHRGFERRDSRLEFCDIGFKLIDYPPDVTQMFQDDIVGFVSHHHNLAAHNPVVNYTASAPEMISINSLVIIA